MLARSISVFGFTGQTYIRIRAFWETFLRWLACKSAAAHDVGQEWWIIRHQVLVVLPPLSGRSRLSEVFQHDNHLALIGWCNWRPFWIMRRLLSEHYTLLRTFLWMSFHTTWNFARVEYVDFSSTNILRTPLCVFAGTKDSWSTVSLVRGLHSDRMRCRLLLEWVLHVQSDPIQRAGKIPLFHFRNKRDEEHISILWSKAGFYGKS